MKLLHRLVYYLAINGCLLLLGCATIKTPKSVNIVIRNAPNSLIKGEKINYKIHDNNDHIIDQGKTDTLGCFSLNRKNLAKKANKFYSLNGISNQTDKSEILENIKVVVEHEGVSRKLKLNNYLDYYDLYLQPRKDTINRDKVADMHYHVSMRSHNKYANAFDNANPSPTNINWHKSFKRLQVLYKGSWQKPTFKSSGRYAMRKKEIFLEGKWIRSKDGANNLKHFSEATHPHILEGNVYLAYNAISSFEHSISKTALNRVISSSFKSGAPYKWLVKMGKTDSHLTHWENFNLEYNMITNQSLTFNQFNWDYFKINSGTIPNPLTKPLVVNVVEGGHILQDKYFPHHINYDIARKTSQEKKDLFTKIIATARNARDTWITNKWVIDSLVLDSIKYSNNHFRNRLKSVKNKDIKQEISSIIRERDIQYNDLELQVKSDLVDTVLLHELKKNITKLKKDLNIHMMAISHLSYNGMTGHSLAIDVSKRPFGEYLVSQLVKRAYHIKSSSDKRYRRSYEGLFFTIPGTNKFGEFVIKELLDSTIRSVHIDLKHSDVQTRRRILDEYSVRSLPPICSHCAVNGLPISFNAPITDEYKLLESSLSRKFYPFGINLYNEEIEEICSKNGIIGLPLEERVLGGYVNNKIPQPRKIIWSQNPKLVNEKNYSKRWAYTKNAFTFSKLKLSSAFAMVEKFYDSLLSDSNVNKRTLEGWSQSDSLIFYKIIWNDYRSLEPFLQNIFHIVDIATKVNSEDSTNNVSDNELHPIFLEKIKRRRKNTSDSIKLTQLEQDFQIHKRLRRNWENICLGSDLDGLIDPINVCPTASHYPEFKQKLLIFTPLFLEIRNKFEIKDHVSGQQYKSEEDYFNNDTFCIEDALDMIFYDNLFQFTKKNFQP